jgi:AICAR transformylase/IMP cyclohydrolase PurH
LQYTQDYHTKESQKRWTQAGIASDPSFPKVDSVKTTRSFRVPQLVRPSGAYL